MQPSDEIFKQVSSMSVSSTNKAIARHALSVIGGTPAVHGYFDAEEKSSIDVLGCSGSPCTDASTYATIGLSESSSGFFSNGKEIGVEVVMAANDRYPLIPNIVSTCAFNRINSQMSIHPGAVHRNVIREYYPESTMAHVLFILPFFWDARLKSTMIENRLVSWLYSMPISNGELEFLDRRGFEALEDELYRADVDILDIGRPGLILPH